MDIQLYSAIIGAFVAITGSFCLHYFSMWQQDKQRNRELMANLKLELINLYIDIKNNTELIKNCNNSLPLSKLQNLFLENLLKNGFPNNWIEKDKNKIIDIYICIRDINKNIQYLDALGSSTNNVMNETYENINITSERLKHQIDNLAFSNIVGLGNFHLDLTMILSRKIYLLADEINRELQPELPPSQEDAKKKV